MLQPVSGEFRRTDQGPTVAPIVFNDDAAKNALYGVAMNDGCMAVWLASTLLMSACVRDEMDGRHSVDQISQAESDRSRVWLESQAHNEAGSVAVTLRYQRADEAEGPRVMELFVQPTGGLTFTGAEAGVALTAAGKTFVAQPQADGSVRLLAFATGDVRRVDTGTLATLHFERTGEGPASLDIRTDSPLFAPQEAADGLLIGDPLEL